MSPSFAAGAFSSPDGQLARGPRPVADGRPGTPGSRPCEQGHDNGSMAVSGCLSITCEGSWPSLSRGTSSSRACCALHGTAGPRPRPRRPAAPDARRRGRPRVGVPALRGLERQGLVRLEWNPSSVGPARRTYYITDDGGGRSGRSRRTACARPGRRCRCSSTATRGWSRGAPTRGRRCTMTGILTATDVRAAFARRDILAAGSASAAPELARACHAMAGRFARAWSPAGLRERLRRGGRRARRRRVRPPVIVGKRALPAMRLAGPHDRRALRRPGRHRDGHRRRRRRAGSGRAGRRGGLGLLTVALAAAGTDVARVAGWTTCWP